MPIFAVGFDVKVTVAVGNNMVLNTTLFFYIVIAFGRSLLLTKWCYPPFALS